MCGSNLSAALIVTSYVLGAALIWVRLLIKCGYYYSQYGIYFWNKHFLTLTVFKYKLELERCALYLYFFVSVSLRYAP